MICVKYFASIREAVGCAEETFDADGLTDVGAVWEAARARHSLEGDALCAVNQRHADFATKLKDGDEVAFFPQITGG